MSNWLAYDHSRGNSTAGAEGGEILHDEKHTGGARVTLKRGNSYVISCSVYGWMDHTRFFSSAADAQREYLLMKSSLTNMVENISSAGGSDLKMWEAIADFVRRFP